MDDRLRIDLLVEDSAQESLLQPLIDRVGQEECARLRVRIRSARGGAGRVQSELRLLFRLIEKQMSPEGLPDLVVVALDANCNPVHQRREQVFTAAPALLQDRLVMACPDPHIEAWYLADPEAFFQVLGHRPQVPVGKCERGIYKDSLARALRAADYASPLGGLELAADLVAAMDLYRAGKNQPSLGAFLDELRAGIRHVGRAWRERPANRPS